MSTPDAPRAPVSPRARPRAWAITSSSSDRPVENDKVREHSPPMVRAATSITEARPSLHAYLGVDRALDQSQSQGCGRGGGQHGGQVAPVPGATGVT